MIFFLSVSEKIEMKTHLMIKTIVDLMKVFQRLVGA